MTETSTHPGIEKTTPSGVTVRFENEPKRRYLLEGVEVPSVTKVLEVLNKPGLSWWGQGIGIEGTLELFRKGELFYDPWHEERGLLVRAEDDFSPDCAATKENVTDLLTKHKLTVNHQLSKAGDRGSSVHRAFEHWCETGQKPDPSIYPPEERGYVEGLLEFMVDVDAGSPRNIDQEVMVGSLEDWYAGRYDASLDLDQVDLVVRHTPVRGAKKVKFPAGRYLFDLKTSADVYHSHMLQLEAYEKASVECGYCPTDYRVVVRVDRRGFYEAVPSRASYDHFRPILQVYRALEDLKAR